MPTLVRSNPLVMFLGMPAHEYAALRECLDGAVHATYFKKLEEGLEAVVRFTPDVLVVEPMEHLTIGETLESIRAKDPNTTVVLYRHRRAFTAQQRVKASADEANLLKKIQTGAVEFTSGLNDLQQMIIEHRSKFERELAEHNNLRRLRVHHILEAPGMARPEDVRSEIRDAILHTQRKRLERLLSFGIPDFEAGKTIMLDAYRGRILKTIVENYRWGSISQDAASGVQSFSPSDRTMRNSGVSSYVIKKFDKDFPKHMRNVATAERLKIRVVRPAAYATVDKATYALLPYVRGPTTAYAITLLDPSLDAPLLEDILKLNIRQLKTWHENQPKVRLQLHEEQSKNIGEYLEKMSKHGLGKMCADIFCSSRDSVYTEFADAKPTAEEVDTFLSAFSQIAKAAYGEDTQASRYLMDNSLENSGFDIGIRNPTREQLLEKLETQQYISIAGKERLADARREALQRTYIRYELHTRPGVPLEDFVHFFHGYEISRFRAQRKQRTGESDELANMYYLRQLLNSPHPEPTRKQIAAYAVMLVYKSLRKQFLVLTKYAANNRNEFEEFRIDQDEWIAKCEDYRNKVLHWTEQAYVAVSMLRALHADRPCDGKKLHHYSELMAVGQEPPWVVIGSFLDKYIAPVIGTDEPAEQVQSTLPFHYR